MLHLVSDHADKNLRLSTKNNFVAVTKKGTGWDNTIKALHIQHVRAQLVDILTRCKTMVRN